MSYLYTVIYFWCGNNIGQDGKNSRIAKRRPSVHKNKNFAGRKVRHSLIEVNKCLSPIEGQKNTIQSIEITVENSHSGPINTCRKWKRLYIYVSEEGLKKFSLFLQFSRSESNWRFFAHWSVKIYEITRWDIIINNYHNILISKKFSIDFQYYLPFYFQRVESINPNGHKWNQKCIGDCIYIRTIYY